MKKKELYLASTSPFKKKELERLEIPFKTLDTKFVEKRVSEETPENYAYRMSSSKALRALKSLQNEKDIAPYVIASDQVVALSLDKDAKILNKSTTEEEAIDQLIQLQNRTHYIITSISLAINGSTYDPPTREATSIKVISEMHMRSLSLAEITEYVRKDQPFGCAGSYKIESYGIQLFESMKTEDYTAIIGLPLTRVRSLLTKANFFHNEEE